MKRKGTMAQHAPFPLCLCIFSLTQLTLPAHSLSLTYTTLPAHSLSHTPFHAAYSLSLTHTSLCLLILSLSHTFPRCLFSLSYTFPRCLFSLSHTHLTLPAHSLSLSHTPFHAAYSLSLSHTPHSACSFSLSLSPTHLSTLPPHFSLTHTHPSLCLLISLSLSLSHTHTCLFFRFNPGCFGFGFDLWCCVGRICVVVITAMYAEFIPTCACNSSLRATLQ